MDKQRIKTASILGVLDMILCSCFVKVIVLRDSEVGQMFRKRIFSASPNFA